MQPLGACHSYRVHPACYMPYVALTRILMWSLCHPVTFHRVYSTPFLHSTIDKMTTANTVFDQTAFPRKAKVHKVRIWLQILPSRKWIHLCVFDSCGPTWGQTIRQACVKLWKRTRNYRGCSGGLWTVRAWAQICWACRGTRSRVSWTWWTR